MCPSAHRDLFRTAPRRLALARRGAIFRDQGEFIENLRSFTPTTPAEDEPATERSFFGGPVDAKVDAQAVAEAAADALFAASLPSEHADAFISHAWRDDATLKWLALCYTSNLFGAVVAASIVWLLLVVGLLGAVGYDVTAYGGATWLKVPCFAAWQTARGSRRTLRRRQGLGRDRRIASIRLGRARRLGDSLGTSTRLGDGRDGSTTGATRRVLRVDPARRRARRLDDKARRVDPALGDGRDPSMRLDAKPKRVLIRAGSASCPRRRSLPIFSTATPCSAGRSAGGLTSFASIRRVTI